MVKCIDCKYSYLEFNGEVENHYDGSCTGSGEYEPGCKFNYKNFSTEKEVDCKRFKIRNIL